MRLGELDDPRLRALAEDSLGGGAGGRSGGASAGVLVDDAYQAVDLGAGFVLTSGPRQIDEALGASSSVRAAGACAVLCRSRSCRGSRGRGAGTPSAWLSSSRTARTSSSPSSGPDWYARQGIEVRVLEPISLRAVTVNPVAPQSHSFDSGELRSRLEAAVPDVPVFDVMGAEYLAAPVQ